MFNMKILKKSNQPNVDGISATITNIKTKSIQEFSNKSHISNPTPLLLNQSSEVQRNIQLLIDLFRFHNAMTYGVP